MSYVSGRFIFVYMPAILCFNMEPRNVKAISSEKTKVQFHLYKVDFLPWLDTCWLGDRNGTRSVQISHQQLHRFLFERLFGARPNFKWSPENYLCRSAAARSWQKSSNGRSAAESQSNRGRIVDETPP